MQALYRFSLSNFGLPTVGAQSGPIAQAAGRERLTYTAYRVEVLSAECDDRDIRRQIQLGKEAKFLRPKRLEGFNLTAVADLPSATLTNLATGAGSTPVNPWYCSLTPAPAESIY